MEYSFVDDPELRDKLLNARKNSKKEILDEKIIESNVTKEDAEASRDEAKALEDERAGVSLDEEAASLIQFQQAFSANARIIQTARELFDSLMMVVSK